MAATDPARGASLARRLEQPELDREADVVADYLLGAADRLATVHRAAVHRQAAAELARAWTGADHAERIEQPSIDPDDLPALATSNLRSDMSTKLTVATAACPTGTHSDGTTFFHRTNRTNAPRVGRDDDNAHAQRRGSLGLVCHRRRAHRGTCVGKSRDQAYKLARESRFAIPVLRASAAHCALPARPSSKRSASTAEG